MVVKPLSMVFPSLSSMMEIESLGFDQNNPSARVLQQMKVFGKVLRAFF
jgi:hypothetical protein